MGAESHDFPPGGSIAAERRYFGAEKPGAVLAEASDLGSALLHRDLLLLHQGPIPVGDRADDPRAGREAAEVADGGDDPRRSFAADRLSRLTMPRRARRERGGIRQFAPRGVGRRGVRGPATGALAATGPPVSAAPAGGP